MADIEPKKQRNFKLSSLAVDNGTSVFILTLMILLLGIQSYQNMPKEQFPEANWPTVYINTPYFGNSAKDIENLISRPLEKEIVSVKGLKSLKSTSMQDYSVIQAEFEADEDAGEATRRIKDAVDLAKAELPSDLDQDPIVQEVVFSEFPIMVVNLSGDFSNDELRGYAEYLQDKIESLDEISRVELKGTMDREVKIEVNLPKMESMEVSFNDIEQAIAMENITMSAGELVNNDFRRAIRVKGEFENVSELERMIVKSENQRPIYLRDIADVSFGFKDRTSIARSDGLPVISLDIIKRAGENLLFASDRIKEIVAETESTFPESLKISFFNDQSIYTRMEVENLENSIISGVILVVLVLLFFLGIRNALFVGLAIPVSMLTGILVLSVLDVTLNIIVLFSLILALGLLVDNAIVVVENIYRYKQNKFSGTDAAKFGAGEVALPIIASTATTLAAFLPLAFWPGIMGEFFKYMPITLIIVLTSSLFVALIINTVFTSRFMKVDEKAEVQSVRRRKTRNILIGSGIMFFLAIAFHFSDVLWARNLLGITLGITLLNFFVLRPASFGFQNTILPALERWYNRFIRGALRVPGLVFVGTFVLLFVAIALLAAFTPKVTYFPSADPMYVNAFIDLPMGKDIEATNKLMKDVEEKVMVAIEPYEGIVEAVLSQIGENTSDPNTPPEPGVTPNKARLTVSFVPSQERGGVSTFDAMEDIRNALKGNPGVQITVDKNADGPPTGKAINLEIQGEDIDRLAMLSDEIINFFNQQNIPGIEELKADVKIGKPEMIINVDREAARRYGVSTMDIAGVIRTAVFGKEVSKFKQGEDEYPIIIRLNEASRNNVDELLNQRITFRSPSNGQISQVPISAVADVSYTSTYSSIKRKDQDRVITVYSNVIEGYFANEINAELAELMADYPLPDGYSYEFTGEQQQQAEDMGFLLTTLVLATFMIFIILVAQFNSILAPFIIILSVFFSIIGVLLGYTFFGETINVIFTGVGVISLAGIVVNNAIVLIDYINLLVKEKREALGLDSMNDMTKAQVKEAIIEGGAVRLRPVLLTAITTILGLFPLAIGFNFNFFKLITELDPHIFIGGDNTAMWGPMAWTVIYGLVFATFLTLVVVPVMYWLAYRLKLGVLRLFKSKTGDLVPVNK